MNEPDSDTFNVWDSVTFDVMAELHWQTDDPQRCETVHSNQPISSKIISSNLLKVSSVALALFIS